jgi:hypothetical protein
MYINKLREEIQQQQLIIQKGSLASSKSDAVILELRSTIRQYKRQLDKVVLLSAQQPQQPQQVGDEANTNGNPETAATTTTTNNSRVVAPSHYSVQVCANIPTRSTAQILLQSHKDPKCQYIQVRKYSLEKTAQILLSADTTNRILNDNNYTLLYII